MGIDTTLVNISLKNKSFKKEPIMKENETIIKTADGVRVSLSDWNEGGAWLSLQHSHGSNFVVFTKAEAEKLLAGLQAVLEHHEKII